MGRARAYVSRGVIVAGAVVALIAPGFAPDGPASANPTSYYGSVARAQLNQPIVDLAATPSGDGYWLVAADGGIFSFGDATFKGGTGGTPLNRPIVGMSSTPSGQGYWLVAADGGIFSFGDAVFQGSTGALRLNQPIVGIAATPTGRGYWLVAADGGIFGFGDAKFYGSTGGTRLASPVTGIAATRDGKGYWMVAEDGGIFTFGTAKFLGAGTGPAAQSTVDIAPSPGGGYWIATTFGAVHVATESGVFLVDPNAAARTPSEAIATELVARINAERRARGLGSVSWHPQLADTARNWANYLGATGAFAHQDLGGVLNSFGGAFNYVSENLYTGTGGAADSGSAHAALMRSDSHRATLLTPELQYVGIGVACVGNKLVVVEDFSVGSGSPTPAARPTPPPAPFVSADENGTPCA